MNFVKVFLCLVSLTFTGIAYADSLAICEVGGMAIEIQKSSSGKAFPPVETELQKIRDVVYSFVVPGDNNLALSMISKKRVSSPGNEEFLIHSSADLSKSPMKFWDLETGIHIICEKK